MLKITEYTVITKDDEFYFEDYDKAKKLFEEIKEDVEQFYSKTWVREDEYSDWEEDWVDIYYTKGDK